MIGLLGAVVAVVVCDCTLDLLLLVLSVAIIVPNGVLIIR